MNLEHSWSFMSQGWRSRKPYAVQVQHDYDCKCVHWDVRRKSGCNDYCSESRLHYWFPGVSSFMSGFAGAWRNRVVFFNQNSLHAFSIRTISTQGRLVWPLPCDISERHSTWILLLYSHLNFLLVIEFCWGALLQFVPVWGLFTHLSSWWKEAQSENHNTQSSCWTKAKSMMRKKSRELKHAFSIL